MEWSRILQESGQVLLALHLNTKLGITWMSHYACTCLASLLFDMIRHSSTTRLTHLQYDEKMPLNFLKAITLMTSICFFLLSTNLIFVSDILWDKWKEIIWRLGMWDISCNGFQQGKYKGGTLNFSELQKNIFDSWYWIFGEENWPKEHGKSCIWIFLWKYCVLHIPWHS